MDKTVIRTPSWSYQGLELEINVTRRYGCFKAILVSCKEQLDALLSRYSRVLVVRLDIRVLDYTPTNAVQSKMLRRLKEWLQDQYQLENIGHIWVREQEKSKRQHYHLALFLDGRKIRHPKHLITWLENYCDLRDLPKPYTPKNCYTMIHRNDPQTYQNAFYRLSYFAKERGKGYKPSATNNYSASRIKPVARSTQPVLGIEKEPY